MIDTASLFAVIRANGRKYSFRHKTGNELFTASLSFSDDVISLEIDPKEPVIFDSIAVYADTDIMDDDRIFLNGYQSWTDSRELTIKDSVRGIDHIPAALVNKYSFDRYGDYNFADYKSEYGALHGFTYAYIRRGDEFTLAGSLSEANGFTMIGLSKSRRRIKLSLDCEGMIFTEKTAALQCAVISGSEKEVFDRYFSLMDIPSPTALPIDGYTSWYRHYQDIDENKLLHDLRAISEDENAHADIFQIDDGYQTAVGDWLSIDLKKFPHGIAPICEKIHEKGMLAGLWLAPFVVEKDSSVYKEHQDWILKDSTGSPLAAGCNWSGSFALDIYNEDVRAYLKEVFDTVLNVWGFDLVKLDFLYAACIIPFGGKSRGRIMADGMALLRELVGDKLILGCGVPLGSAFGKVDYCRIGCDVGLDWNDNPVMRMTHRERVSTKNSVINTIFRRQLGNRAFLNDPDVFLLRAEDISLFKCQKQLLSVVNNIFGSVYFTSDDISRYMDSQKKMLSTARRMRKADVKNVTSDGDRVSVTFEINGKEKTIVLDLTDGKII